MKEENTTKFPLMAAQSAIWLDQYFHPGKPIYHAGGKVTIKGPLDAERFKRAIYLLVQETEALRLCLHDENGVVTQSVRDIHQVDVEHVDFSTLPDPEATAQAWIEENFWRPMDLNDFPLFRFSLVTIGAHRHVWVQLIHHIVADATARRLVTLRVANIYNALREGHVPPNAASAPFAAVMAAYDTYIHSDQYPADRQYWMTRFAVLPEPLFEGDQSKSEREKSGRPTRLIRKIPRAAMECLAELAKANGTTTFKAITALIHIAFSRIYGASDIVFGVPLANRTAAFRETIALFIQVMPFRVNISRTATLAEVLARIDDALAKDLAHRNFPMGSLSNLLQISRQGRSGLFDVAINYINLDYTCDFDGAPIEAVSLAAGFYTRWAILISDMSANSSAQTDIDLIIDYDSGLIDSAEADSLARCLRFLLTNGLNDLTLPVGRLPIMEPAEREQLLAVARGTKVDVPEATLAELCNAQAARTPDAIAVVCGEDSIDFKTLHARAQALARRLVAMGIGPDRIVGLALPRTIELIVAVLAVHKAGGAYLPLDPAYPRERISYIVTDAGASVIITTAELAAQLPNTDAKLLLTDGPAPDPVQSEIADAIPTAAVRPDHLAYVIYTSGSTGRPKGTGIEHRSAVNLALWGRSLIEPEDLSGVLFSTSLNFDLSVYELFMPLICGGRIVVVDSLMGLITAPAREQVRLINTVPSLINALIAGGGRVAMARTINLCGEPLTRTLADRIFATAPEVRLFNFYGPTETTVYSTWSQVTSADRAPPAIGVGLWNTHIYVLDADLAPVPQGAQGELFIGGAGVARGYLHRPDLTAERFLNNPYGKGRIYRTGDLVRYRPNGELEFIGRADGQIKINGLRVELGEIEAQILAVPGVAAAAAVVRPNKIGVNQLFGYAVPMQGQEPPTFEAIRTSLQRVLPRHMIPQSIMWLEALPQTPNGKLDRRALPAPPETDTKQDNVRGPTNDLERGLVETWENILQVKPIGMHDDFFTIGGDSLLAIQLILAVHERFSINITPEVLLTKANTVAGMAKEVSRGSKSDTAIADIDFVDFEAAMQNRPALYKVDRATGLRVAKPNVTVGSITTNSLGFRSPEISKTKPPGTIRLMFLGTSSTFDSMVSNNEATWPHQTWLNLREAYPALNLEYVNCALPASSTVQLLKRYKGGLSDLSADIIVIRVHDVNHDAAYQARSQGIYNGVHHRKSWLARKSDRYLLIEKNLVVLSRLLFPNHWPRKIKFDTETAMQHFALNLENLVTLCRQNGATVVLFEAQGALRERQSALQQRLAAGSSLYFMPFMTIPGLLAARQAYLRVQREVAERAGSLLIDIGGAVPADRMHFADAGHYRDAGSRVAARALSQALIEAGIVTQAAKAAGLPTSG